MNSQTLTTLAADAQAASISENWLEAARLWQKVSEIDPAYPDCFNKAAVALRNLGRFDESDAVIQTAISTLGSRPLHHIILGDTAMDRKKWRKALGHWQDLRQIAPDRPKGYLRAAQAYLALNELDQAASVCAEGLVRFPDSAALLSHHAEIAIRQQRRPEARARHEAAVKHAPNDIVIQKQPSRIIEAPEPTNAEAAKARLPKNLDHLSGTLTKLGRFFRAGLIAAVSKNRTKNPLERDLDAVQKQGSKVPLRDRINLGKTAWEKGYTNTRHQGQLRHFDKAQSDARLSAILSGDVRRSPLRNPNEAIRVVFYFPHVTQTDNLTPLFETMHTDPRFEPMILCSRYDGTAQADAYPFFAAKYPAAAGYKVIDGGAHVNFAPSFYELDADLVFFHTPYSLNAPLPFYLRADFATRHCRVAHVTYGYPLLSLDTKSYHVYAGDHVKLCDFVFAESPVCVEPYGRHLQKDRIRVTGYTKLDEFRRHLVNRPFEEKAADLATRLDVMWTPHWQLPGDSKGDTETSNFLRYYQTMLRVAARPDITLHVRPHPLLRLRANAMGIMAFRKYDAVMEQFRAAGAKLYPAEEGVSYIPALMQADVLISDFSSLVAEYTITDRPIIFCRTDDVWNNEKWIGAFGRQLIENCCYVVDDETMLESALDTILSTRKHPKADRMAQFVKDHELFPEGSASMRICDIIATELRQGQTNAHG
ncbi:CDP-glycerol glycerophosphotransferase family protein [Paracoccus sp. 11-3]|uniref:CDP-glycerol glycerophosphotransferase family protein n=1 Tax=Paracoccus amoyensis TaxID=2760093 RepID=A0A926G9F0_9RHOB|nr:CDP-glycerol glycerophosphotransferase family protein [Paracoccus amoyensis]MBC9245736.1 CDP-glycerol glycerophosphotransferase family protein [Paracoccus amoyensis]